MVWRHKYGQWLNKEPSERRRSARQVVKVGEILFPRVCTESTTLMSILSLRRDKRRLPWEQKYWYLLQPEGAKFQWKKEWIALNSAVNKYKILKSSYKSREPFFESVVMTVI